MIDQRVRYEISDYLTQIKDWVNRSDLYSAQRAAERLTAFLADDIAGQLPARPFNPGTMAGKVEVAEDFDAPETTRMLKQQLDKAQATIDGLIERTKTQSTDLVEHKQALAETEAQLSNALNPSHYSSREGRIRTLEARIAELEAQLAAAKPVLTTEETATMAIWRNSSARELLAIIDRLCPPPKAPPTDAELIAYLSDALGKPEWWRAVNAVADALHARSAE